MTSSKKWLYHHIPKSHHTQLEMIVWDIYTRAWNLESILVWKRTFNFEDSEGISVFQF